LIKSTIDGPLAAGQPAAMTHASNIHVIATLKAQSGHAEPFAAALRQLTEAARGAPGNLRFELYQGTDADTFVCLETWQDAAAADAHMGSPYVARVLGTIGPLLAGPPAIVRHARLA
jgi:quinol monooxygenase YgiN